MSYATQRKEGFEQNKIYTEDRPIHEWYRFVLSYPPHLVRDYIKKFCINSTNKILDPFCGTGTTLVESKKLGISSVGIEANPIVQMAASAKVNWDIDYDALLYHSHQIAIKTKKQLLKYGKNLKTLTVDKEKLLIENSISPIPLHKTLVLLEVLAEMNEDQFYDIQRTALAKQLVSAFSNLRFGPEVGISRKKKIDMDVVELWLDQIQKMVNDLKSFVSKKDVDSKVCLGDARSVSKLVEKQSIDAVITSPPYPNEKDYTRTTRLESVLLDFIVTKSDLRSNKENLLRSNTRNIYKGDEDEKWIENNERIIDLANSIETRRIKLEKTSGFERLYHKVVKSYFGGMARHLSDLKPLLKTGAKLAYVVGDQASYFRIPIRTGEILADIAVDLGYELINIDLFRTRISTVTKEQLREEVVLLKWND
jgi:DNA methylase